MPFPAAVRLIRVAVIDDEGALLEFVTHHLWEHPDFAAPRAYATAAEAIRELRRDPADIALVDLHLAGESGFQCIERLRTCKGATHVLAHTVADDEPSLAQAFAAGAHGYLIKGQSLKDLSRALRELWDGRPAISPGALQHIIQRFRPIAPTPPPQSGLSPAEWRVLSETAAGLDCKAIAVRLNVALGTVYVHNRNIFTKLNVKTRLAAVERFRQMANAANNPPATKPEPLPEPPPQRPQRPRPKPNQGRDQPHK